MNAAIGGARIMQNQEEPVVYLTRSDYDTQHLKQAAYTKEDDRKTTVKRKKTKRPNGIAKSPKQGAKTVKAKSKTGTKKSTKMMAKTKKTKKTSIAARAADGTNG